MAIYDVYVKKDNFKESFRINPEKPGSIGEAMARAVVESYLKENNKDVNNTKILKHINTPGSDFTFIYQNDKNENYIIVGDNKDYSEVTWKNKKPEKFIEDVKKSRETWAKKIIEESYGKNSNFIEQEVSKLSESRKNRINEAKDKNEKEKTEVDMIYQNMLEEGRIKTVISTTNTHISDPTILNQLQKENIDYFQINDSIGKDFNLQNYNEIGKDIFIREISIKSINKEQEIRRSFLR